MDVKISANRKNETHQAENYLPKKKLSLILFHSKDVFPLLNPEHTNLSLLGHVLILCTFYLFFSNLKVLTLLILTLSQEKNIL